MLRLRQLMTPCASRGRPAGAAVIALLPIGTVLAVRRVATSLAPRRAERAVVERAGKPPCGMPKLHFTTRHSGMHAISSRFEISYTCLESFIPLGLGIIEAKSI